ncbi:MAG TPA: flagellar basal body-associated FliL family protein [Planctomycetaceae bacterium]|nr:flagellar basal body-associated FliL family protein [Planctomycetaceae bacterium]
MATDTLPDLSSDPALGAPPGGKRTLLFVALAVIVTAVVTGLAVSMWGGGAARPDAEHDAEPHVSDTIEVEIGSFNCSNNQADGSVVHVTFRLFATIAAGQQTAFKDVVQNRMNARVRQAVGKVIRSSSMEDLDDPDQSVARRQLKEEINKVLRKSYINEVILVDFRMLQQ